MASPVKDISKCKLLFRLQKFKTMSSGRHRTFVSLETQQLKAKPF